MGVNYLGRLIGYVGILFLLTIVILDAGKFLQDYNDATLALFMLPIRIIAALWVSKVAVAKNRSKSLWVLALFLPPLAMIIAGFTERKNEHFVVYDTSRSTNNIYSKLGSLFGKASIFVKNLLSKLARYFSYLPRYKLTILLSGSIVGFILGMIVYLIINRDTIRLREYGEYGELNYTPAIITFISFLGVYHMVADVFNTIHIRIKKEKWKKGKQGRKYLKQFMINFEKSNASNKNY